MFPSAGHSELFSANTDLLHTCCVYCWVQMETLITIKASDTGNPVPGVYFARETRTFQSLPPSCVWTSSESKLCHVNITSLLIWGSRLSVIIKMTNNRLFISGAETLDSFGICLWHWTGNSIEVQQLVTKTTVCDNRLLRDLHTHTLTHFSRIHMNEWEVLRSSLYCVDDRVRCLHLST